MAAQERETSERTSVVGSVGAVALMAVAAVAVTAPVATVVAAVAVAAVVAVRRRGTVERFAGRDTRDGPDRPCPEPAACD